MPNFSFFIVVSPNVYWYFGPNIGLKSLTGTGIEMDANIIPARIIPPIIAILIFNYSSWNYDIHKDFELFILKWKIPLSFL